MPCPLPHSLHIPISWQFTRTHHARASSRTLSMNPPCSHIWHTYLQSYYPQRHLTCNHFNDWIVHENTCPLQMRVLKAREKLLYLPSPTFNPTIVRDQKINPAKVAFSGLQGQCKLLKFQTKLAIKPQTSFMHMQMLGLLCFVILIDTTSFTIWCKHIRFCNCRNCLVPFKRH